MTWQVASIAVPLLLTVLLGVGPVHLLNRTRCTWCPVAYLLIWLPLMSLIYLGWLKAVIATGG